MYPNFHLYGEAPYNSTLSHAIAAIVHTTPYAAYETVSRRIVGTQSS